MAIVAQAGAIVVRSDGDTPHVLLVTAKRDPRHWIFPKGHIEPGERPEATALREAREEAGVVGRVVAPAGTIEFPAGDDTMRVQYFLVEHERDVPPSEARERVWLPFDEALERLTFADSRSLLRGVSMRAPRFGR